MCACVAVRVSVLPADEEARRPQRGCKVDGGVEVTLAGGTLSKVGSSHCASLAQLHHNGSTAGMGLVRCQQLNKHIPCSPLPLPAWVSSHCAQGLCCPTNGDKASRLGAQRTPTTTEHHESFFPACHLQRLQTASGLLLCGCMLWRA